MCIYYIKSILVYVQMIVDRIFTQKSEALLPLNTILEEREFNEIKENAIYYAAGYIIRKLIWKYEKAKGENSKVFIYALWDMIGEDCHSVEATSTYNDYVKIWIKAQDRGGLQHVSNDTFNCFKTIEVVTYQLIEKGYEKEYVTSQTYINSNILFCWELISDLEQERSMELLHDVIDLWFTMRGFALANRLFEEYKQTSKSNIKGKKGLRKTLQ